MLFNDLTVESRQRVALSLGGLVLAGMLASCGGGGAGGGGGASPPRSTPATADVTAADGTVNPADIITRASADVPFSQQRRSEENTSALQSRFGISYAVFC